MGDYPAATRVFDLDSIGLLRLVDSLNHGADPAGKAMQDRTSFLLACGPSRRRTTTTASSDGWRKEAVRRRADS